MSAFPDASRGLPPSFSWQVTWVTFQAQTESFKTEGRGSEIGVRDPGLASRVGARAGDRGRDSPRLAGASLGSGPLSHVGPALPRPGRGVLQAPGSRPGAGFPRLCKAVAEAKSPLRRVGSGARPGPGDGWPVRGPWRAVGAHSAVRPAAHAAGRAVRDPGQLRRPAGLAWPG